MLALGLGLFLIWLAWSGHYEPLTVALGALSCLLVVAITVRMGMFRNVRGFIEYPIRSLRYFPWLALQILKANLEVARRVLHPRLPISPVLVRIKAGQKTAIARVLYANSITLTPGTVTVDLSGDELTVHALTREAAEELASGEMDRRVTMVEGGR
jgi:multicomponent Na+:H+ antiporter subunit E